MKPTNQPLMAFWEYDLFPYMLCDRIREIKEDGWVKTEKYGTRCFRPICIVPETSMALEFKEHLESARKYYNEAQTKLHNDWIAKLVRDSPFDLVQNYLQNHKKK